MRGQRKVAVLVVIGTFCSSALLTVATCSGDRDAERPAETRRR